MCRKARELHRGTCTVYTVQSQNASILSYLVFGAFGKYSESDRPHCEQHLQIHSIQLKIKVNEIILLFLLLCYTVDISIYPLECYFLNDISKGGKHCLREAGK